MPSCGRHSVPGRRRLWLFAHPRRSVVAAAAAVALVAAPFAVDAATSPPPAPVATVAGSSADAVRAAAAVSGRSVAASTRRPSRDAERPARAVAPRGGVVVSTVPTAVPAGGRLRVSGLGPAGATVAAQRRRAGHWVTVRTFGAAQDGRFRAAVPSGPVGTAAFRLVPQHLRGARPLLLRPVEVYRSVTYRVRTLGPVAAHVAAFAAQAQRTYDDPHGWRRAHVRFRRVAQDADFTLWLVSSDLVRTFSRTCSRWYSCSIGEDVVLNAERWLRASPSFSGTLREYRDMVLNHETGHWFGLAHRFCETPGALAPVMQQQSKGMQGCRANPWPLAAEVRAAQQRSTG